MPSALGCVQAVIDWRVRVGNTAGFLDEMTLAGACALTSY